MKNKSLQVLQYPSIALVGCILLSAAVCYSQIIGNQFLILLCLMWFLLFSIWASNHTMIFPVLLYFLPWSPLLKLESGGISFFTVALLFVCIIAFVKGGFNFDVYQLILAILIIIVTLIAKLLQENSLQNSYLFFLLMILLFPSVVKNKSFLSTFKYVTLFFACGIITAALSAQQVADYPNILQYIKVDSYLNIVRRSGYYGDPNFYCAQITACLAGIQLLLSKEKKRITQLFLFIMMIILIYCGLLSASKSFILITSLLLIVWIPIIFSEGSHRLELLIGIVCIGIVAFTSPAFEDLLQIVDSRLTSASNLSEFTTGRTDLWLSYLNEFSHHPLLTFLGEGYSDVTVNGRASHNTIIQGIFQFGVFGFPLILAWVIGMLKNTFGEMLGKNIDWKVVLLMGIGVILPWFGLDILFFDEFFLLPVYLCLGVFCFTRKTV